MQPSARRFAQPPGPFRDGSAGDRPRVRLTGVHGVEVRLGPRVFELDSEPGFDPRSGPGTIVLLDRVLSPADRAALRHALSVDPAALGGWVDVVDG